MSLTLEKILAASPATTRGQPTQLSCDAKGERIAYASGKSIFVRSIDHPSQSKQYTGHTTTTSCARFSPSGYYIASGDISGSLRIWDAVECATTKGTHQIISGRINDVAWDGDSARVMAVGNGRDRFGHCVTADSGNSVGEVSGHSKVINGVAMRQQRPFRAATVSDDGSLCFLHGAPFKFAAKSSGLHKGFVYGVGFSPDGNLLVSVGADGRIQLYDGKTGEATETIGEGVHRGSIFSVSWAKDSKRFVTAGADQSVRIWDAESGENVQTWHLGPEGAVDAGHQQVGVVWPQGRSDGLIISLNLNGDLNYLVEGKAEPVKVVQGHNKSITAMGSSGGKELWTGSFDGRVCLWNTDKGTGDVVDGAAHTNQVSQFAVDAKHIYSVGWDDTLRVIDPSAKIFVGTSTKLDAQPRGVGILEGGKLAVGTAAEIVVMTADGKTLNSQPTDYSPDIVAGHGHLVAAADSHAVRIYKADPVGKLSEATKLANATSQISALSFSRDGQHLAAGTSGGKIFVYKTDDWSLVTDRWSAHTAKVLNITWNSTGTHAISGSLDTHVYVWSLAKPGSRVKVLNAHKDGVNGVCWLDADTKVASAGGDAAIKVWSVSGLQ